MTISTMVSKPSIRRLPAKAGADQIIKILLEDGVVIIEEFRHSSVIDQLNHEVAPHLADYAKNLPAVFANRHGPHCKRINNLVAKSKTLRDDLLNDPLVHDICGKIYTEQQRTDYWMTSAMLLEHSPGGKAGPYHRDQNFFPLAKLLGAAAPLVVLNFFVALTDMTAENGGTRVVPGSHLWAEYEDWSTAEMGVPMEMKAGDMCLLGGKTVHGSGGNTTVDSLRRILILGVQAGYLTPYEATPLHVEREIVDSMTPLAQKMIGWRSPTIDGTPTWTVDCGDVGAWWERSTRQQHEPRDQ
ncbi:hypothetical protein ASPCAL06858 [Aspergillus calidoustus]|uniref:Phytanoyl-CoA dioxygenase family protein n=1 Tax=Aspergillus calidoustus TaxID=454130 RepID=A0A0U5G829_ASPCI|nr:hypothetical protein ASPCAL06858 [Aspergillus calidoustus]